MTLVALRYTIEWNTALAHAVLIEGNEHSQETTTIDSEDLERADVTDDEYY